MGQMARGGQPTRGREAVPPLRARTSRWARRDSDVPDIAGTTSRSRQASQAELGVALFSPVEVCGKTLVERGGCAPPDRAFDAARVGRGAFHVASLFGAGAKAYGPTGDLLQQRQGLPHSGFFTTPDVVDAGRRIERPNRGLDDVRNVCEGARLP